MFLTNGGLTGCTGERGHEVLPFWEARPSSSRCPDHDRGCRRRYRCVWAEGGCRVGGCGPPRRRSCDRAGHLRTHNRRSGCAPRSCVVCVPCQCAALCACASCIMCIHIHPQFIVGRRPMMIEAAGAFTDVCGVCGCMPRAGVWFCRGDAPSTEPVTCAPTPYSGQKIRLEGYLCHGRVSRVCHGHMCRGVRALMYPHASSAQGLLPSKCTARSPWGHCSEPPTLTDPGHRLCPSARKQRGRRTTGACASASM
jgi:hypothetical protein